MASKPPKRVSIFAQAASSDAVRAEIRTDDVLAIATGCSMESARVFLGRHAEAIASAMLEAGLRKMMDIIDDIADEGGKRGC